MEKNEEKRKELIEGVDTSLKNLKLQDGLISDDIRSFRELLDHNAQARENLEQWKMILEDVNVPNEFFTKDFGSQVFHMKKIIENSVQYSGGIVQNRARLMSNSASMNSSIESGTYILRLNAKVLDLPGDHVVFTFTSPLPSEIREEVGTAILKIDDQLHQKFITTWQLYFDDTFEFWVNLPTQELREFILGFLHKLAPDDKVELVLWCRKDKNRITHLTRAIYVILGDQRDIDLQINRLGPRSSDSFIQDTVISAAKRIVKVYHRANKYAHWQGRDIPEDIKVEIEKLLMEFLQSLKQILELRETNFKVANY